MSLEVSAAREFAEICEYETQSSGEDISPILQSTGLKPNLDFQVQGQIQAGAETVTGPTAEITQAGSFTTPTRRKIPVPSQVARPIPFKVDTSPLALRSSRYRATRGEGVGGENSAENQQENKESVGGQRVAHDVCIFNTIAKKEKSSLGNL